MITTILFDLDGTLCDLEIRYINPFKQTILEFRPDITNQEINEILDQLWVMLGKKSSYMIFKIVWTIASKLDLNLIDRVKFLKILKSRYSEHKKIFEFLEGAERTLEYCLKHYKVGIVTSAFREDLKYGYRDLALLNQVDVVIDIDSVNHPKPNPEPINMALEQLQSKPEETIFIGDLPTDIISGKGAMVKTIAFEGTLGTYTQHLLEQQKPDLQVKNHEELLKILLDMTSDNYYSNLPNLRPVPMNEP